MKRGVEGGLVGVFVCFWAGFVFFLFSWGLLGGFEVWVVVGEGEDGLLVLGLLLGRVGGWLGRC